LPEISKARAMVLEQPHSRLLLKEVSVPAPGPGQVLLKVRACGICRTDLHLVDGELPEPKLPIVPGHQIVGVVMEAGAGVERPRVGDRVGVPWLGWTCGECVYCRTGRENLCDRARFTVISLVDQVSDRQIHNAVQNATAVAADPDTARRLGCPPGVPVLQIERLYCDRDLVPLELAVNHFHPDRYSYRLQMRGRVDHSGTGGGAR